MKAGFALIALLLLPVLFGCFGASSEKSGDGPEAPASSDGEIKLIVGENYTIGEPIAIQLKTTNYSISFLNRSGGYALGEYPSVWICRKTEGNCENVEYRRMADFSACSRGVLEITVPPESKDKRDVFPAEFYGLLLRWEQKDYKEVRTPCGNGFASARKGEQVPRGNYSVTFVYFVSWDSKPKSVSADFRIV